MSTNATYSEPADGEGREDRTEGIVPADDAALLRPDGADTADEGVSRADGDDPTGYAVVPPAAGTGTQPGVPAIVPGALADTDGLAHSDVEEPDEENAGYHLENLSEATHLTDGGTVADPQDATNDVVAREGQVRLADSSEGE